MIKDFDDFLIYIARNQVIKSSIYSKKSSAKKPPKCTLACRVHCTINFEWELKKETLNKETQYKQARLDIIIHNVCTHIYFTLDIWYKL